MLLTRVASSLGFWVSTDRVGPAVGTVPASASPAVLVGTSPSPDAAVARFSSFSGS